MKLHYRPEIDGLRAVAVLPVIFYHAGFAPFSGGYVGVDVFFVISGFLITSIIMSDVAAGKFSFGDFYERRARRILPALFLMVTVCIPLAWMWMLPKELKAFSTSVVAVALFSSNILFWRQTDYFATGAEFKPLLHTWSLGVEEQFYFIFPAVLLLLWRFGRTKAVPAIALLAAASFILCTYAYRYHPAFNFYWLPTRAWELLTGSLSSFIVTRPAKLRDGALSLAGLAAIAVPVFTYGELTPMPSAFAIPPVVGTCLLLVCAREGTFARDLLSTPLLVGIGLVSYSAYLWHQPLFAFARLRSVGEPSPFEFAALSALSLALAYCSWRFLEIPVRRSKSGLFSSRKKLFGTFGAMSALFIFIGMAGHLTNGFLKTFTTDPEKLAFITNWSQYSDLADIPSKYGYACDFQDHDSYRRGIETTAPRSAIDPSCYTRDPSKAHAVFIWGDSHAQMLRYGLQQTLPADWQILQVAASSCAPSFDPTRVPFCDTSNAFAKDSIIKTKPDVVVLAQQMNHDPAKLRELSAFSLASGVKKVVITGPTPQWRGDLPVLITRNFWGIPANRTLLGVRTDLLDLSRALQWQLAGDPRIQYVSLTDVFCTEQGCLMYVGGDPQNGLVTWDYGHLTPRASQFLAEKSLENAVVGGP